MNVYILVFMRSPMIWPLRDVLQEMIVSEIETRERGSSLLKRYGTTSLARAWRGGGWGVVISRSRFFFTRISNPTFVYQKRQFLQKLIKCNLFISPFPWYFQFARVLRAINKRNSFSHLSMVTARDTTTWWVVLTRVHCVLDTKTFQAQPRPPLLHGGHFLTGVRIVLWQLVTDITHWTGFFD